MPEQQNQQSAARSKKRSVVMLSVLLIVLIFGGMAAGGYALWHHVHAEQLAAEQSAQPTPVIPEELNIQESTESLPQNPIDFPAQKAQNPDIYSWIFIPGTNINLPVLQHPTDDNFYLKHAVDGNPSDEGAIYSQSMNATDYTDPVTVLYGHNLKSNTMFTQLHYFENADFFNNNDLIYIYAPGRILTYRVVSAYLSDSRHIMNSYDFSNLATRQAYFDQMTNPDALIKNTRNIALDASTDKIIQLSTCSNDHDRRYIVTGVLIDEQPTA